MNAREAIEAKLSGTWRQSANASTAFRLHIRDFPERAEGLSFFLHETCKRMGVNDARAFISGAGPSTKFEGAGVIALNLAPPELAIIEDHVEEADAFLGLNGVLCVEFGDAVFKPSKEPKRFLPPLESLPVTSLVI